VDFAATASPDPAGWRLDLAFDGRESALEGTCGGPGPERVVFFEAPEDGRFTFTTEAPEAGGFVDTVLHVRTACEAPETELSCNDEAGPGRGPSRVELALRAGEGAFVVVDTFNVGAQGAARLRLQAATLTDEGEACDPLGQPRRCAEGLRCLDRGGPEPVCARATPPTLTAAEVRIDPTFAAVALTAQGDDAEDDVTELRVEFFDYAGHPAAQATLAGAASDAGRFAFAGRVECPARVPWSAVLVAVDAAGLESAPLRVDDLPPLPIADLGGACDPAGLGPLCPPRATCVDAGPGPVCRGFDGRCPGHPALDQQAPDAQGRYTLDGDSRGIVGRGRLECVTDGAVWSALFTAPAAGRWSFMVDASVGASPLGDAAVDVTASCDAFPVLACGRDGSIPWAAVTRLDLAAGETVAVHVGSERTRSGTFRLYAQQDGPAPPPAAPVILSATVESMPVAGLASLSVESQLAESASGDLLVDLQRAGRLLLRGHRVNPYRSASARQRFTVARVVDETTLPFATAADTARLMQLDERGVGAGWFTTPVTPVVPPRLAAGAVCSASPFELGLCEDAAPCVDTDADAATAPLCEPVADACPAAWAAEPVDVAGEPPYRVESSVFGAPRLATSFCGPAGRRALDLHSFTAPSAGTWRFGLQSGAAEAFSLGLRRSCTDPYARADLACVTDPGGDPRPSETSLALAAGETVYLGVTGPSQDPANSGYGVTISPAGP
jgi:hypothetical protein